MGRIFSPILDLSLKSKVELLIFWIFCKFSRWREGGTLFQDPGTMFQDPGTLFQDPGTIFQDPGTILGRAAPRLKKLFRDLKTPTIGKLFF